MEKENNSKPLKVKCFHCQKLITVKYVRASHDYSNKNNWEYWTGQPQYKDYYICDECLIKLYRQHKWEFRQLIKDKKKQTLFRQYLANGDIKGKVEAVFINNKDNKVCWLGENCPNLKKKKKRVITERMEAEFSC